jgi:hypothetical protein
MSERGTSTGFALLAAVIPALLVCNSAIAQVGTIAATPTLNATSPLGAAPGASVEPTGIPLGATEITSPGLSPAPTGVTGTISIPSTSSGSACSTAGTAPSSMFGSTASFDGGGMGIGIGTGSPATATTAGSPSMTGTTAMSGTSASPGISSILGTSGVSATSGTLETAGMSGMCGSGSNSVISSSTPTSTAPTAPGGMARTGIPLDSTEIGNLGVSATPAVPTPAVSPIVGFVGPTPLAPTIPTISPPPTTTSTAPMSTIGSTRILPTTITPGGF